MRTPALVSLVLLALSGVAPAAPQDAGPLIRGGDVTPVHECSSPLEQLLMKRELDRYRKQVGELAGPAVAPTYPMYPQAGNPNGDLTCTNYVDLRSGSGIRDWRCTGYTYNGHDASDALIRTFGEQDIGVPIFAALDGRVVSVVDGYFDRNIQWAGTGPANRVQIDHGGGLVTNYLHFKKNSIIVKRNQRVFAGQQLGLTGSSGRSSWPHLHFSTKQSGKTIEPFTGNCNRGTSMWKNQPNFGHSLRIWDAGVSRISPGSVKRLPEPPPAGGWVAKADTYVYLWVMVLSLPTKSNYRLRFKRPNGTVALQTAVLNFNNSVLFRLARYWWRYSIPDMKRITGRWTIELDVNGKRMFTAPVEVTAGSAPKNRPPRPVSVRLDPSAPSAVDPIFCRVTVPLINDDDYDIVRYRYQWLVNGVVVRNIVHAGEADAIPRHVALSGDKVECIVTPSDGKTSAVAARVSVVVSGSTWKSLGFAKKGRLGFPLLRGYGSLSPGHSVLGELRNANPNSTAYWALSTQRGNVKIFGGTLIPSPILQLVGTPTSATGTASLKGIWPARVPKGIPFYAQCWIADRSVGFWFSASNAVQGTSQ